MSILGIPLEAGNGLATAPSVVLYGPPGVGKSFEMARSFSNVLYVQSSHNILHALAQYATAHPEKKLKLPDRVTLDEKTVAQHFGGSMSAALLTIMERYVQACDKGESPYEGIVFDEWNVFCERLFAELKSDPWNKFRGKSGVVNIFAVMDGFKQIHRSMLSIARRTRKMVGFVAHYQGPRVDEDENSPTRGSIKWPGGPKMPVGLSDQVVELCADADVVLQMMVKEGQAASLSLDSTTPKTGIQPGQRMFCTQLDGKYFRKVRGGFDLAAEELLDVKQGHGLRELLVRAGFPV